MVMASPLKWRLRDAPSIVIERRGNRARPIRRGPLPPDSGSRNDRGRPTESASLFHPDDGQGHGLGRIALFGIAGDEGNRQS